MTAQARRSPLELLAVAVIRFVARHPYLTSSVVIHAALLALLYYFGSYQPELRQQEAEVASSLRATHLASTATRLQDLQTIKRLLEKSADRVESETRPAEATPDTPEEMVARARELSREIDELDAQIRAEELHEITQALEPRQAAETKPAESHENGTPVREPDPGAQAPITPEMAANEVSRLEAKARTVLAQRERRLEAKADGVRVEGSKTGSGEPNESGNSAASRPEGAGRGDSVRAEIAEYIGSRTATDDMTRSKTYLSLDFFADGSTEIPPVDATTLVRGRGRMLGAGGEYANRVYLNSWYMIGPFPGRHGAELFDNPAYPPEKAVLLDAVYFGKDQRLLQWRYVTPQHYPLVPPDMVEDSVYYGYTEVFVDQACDLVAWIGADDDVQVYLNDQLVWKGGNVNKRPYFHAVFNTRNTYLRDYNRTEGKRVVHFNKGRNKIFFKLSNGPNNPYLSMVLTR